MYTLHYDGQLLHDPRSDVKLASCTFEGEVNTAGTLSFTIAPTHPLYGSFQRMNPLHEVTLEDDGKEIFRGRITSETVNMDTTADIEVQGQLGYLNDTLIRPYGTYPDTSDDPQWTTIAPGTQYDYAEWLVNQHNAKADGSKRFVIRSLELGTASITRSSTQYPSTANEILDKVLDPMGMLLSASYVDGERVLDFTANPRRMPQVVEYGGNITDINSEIDASGVITCIIPECKAISDDTPDPDINDYPDGEIDIDHAKEGDRVYSIPGVSDYGFIEETRSYDADTLGGLVEQVMRDLDESHVVLETLETSVIDLHLVDGSIPSIWLGDMLRLVARPHGIDQWMLASKCSLDICEPANSSWGFGALRDSLTRSNAGRTRLVEQTAASAIQTADAISDTAQQAAQDAQQASEDAQDAIQAAAEKRRVFTSTPTPPYDVGDIWIVGDGEIRECIVAKDS